MAAPPAEPAPPGALPPRPRVFPLRPVADAAPDTAPPGGAVREVDRRCRPILAVWELTLRCDLACRHCGSRAGRARPRELDTAQALDLVRQLAQLGTREVTLIGGEAYLREDWLRIARAIRHAGMDLTLVTGGRGLTAGHARALKDLGVTNVSVSVDGPEPLHDALRGVPGSWRAALQAIAHLGEAGIVPSANTQVTRPALTRIEPMLTRLVDAGIHSWQVMLTVPMGRAADEPSLILEPFQMLELMPMVARAGRLLRARGRRLWPGNNIGYFGPYETVLRGTMPRGHMAACGAGRTVIGIEADGTVKGCPSLPTRAYAGGNVQRHALKDIWERAAVLQQTRAADARPLWGACAGCYYAQTCRGGCTWTAHAVLGRPGNNPFCHHRALEYLAQGLRERLRPVRAAGGAPFDHGLCEIILEPWPDDELARARALVRSGEGWLLHTEREHAARPGT